MLHVSISGYTTRHILQYLMKDLLGFMVWGPGIGALSQKSKSFIQNINTDKYDI